MLYFTQIKGCTMGSIINFSQAKKKIVRIKQEKQASENRTKHGRPKAVKTLIKKEQQTAKNHLDSHKIDKGPDKD